MEGSVAFMALVIEIVQGVVFKFLCDYFLLPLHIFGFGDFTWCEI